MDGITESMDMNLGKLWEMVRDWGTWRAAVHGVAKIGHDLVTKQNNNNIHRKIVYNRCNVDTA